MLQKEIDEAKAEWERGLQLARDRNAKDREAWQKNAREALIVEGDRRAYLVATDKARLASRRTAWLNSYLAALKAGKPLPVAPRSIFGADELKYMSAHGCPVEVTP